MRSSCTLLDVLIAPDGREEEVLAAWIAHSRYMRTQPGLVAAQQHRGISGSHVFVNLAVWESPAALHRAVDSPGFRELVVDYPEGTVCMRSLVRPIAIPGMCVA